MGKPNVIPLYYWVFPIYRENFYEPYFSVLLSYCWVLALRWLVFNNLIYVWRAKTEEAHLMRYPEYREYAAWMQENGIITRALYRIKQRLMGSARISGLHSRG